MKTLLILNKDIDCSSFYIKLSFDSLIIEIPDLAKGQNTRRFQEGRLPIIGKESEQITQEGENPCVW